MEVNLSMQLKNADGSPALTAGNKPKPVILGDVIVFALLETAEVQHPLSAAEKLKRYAIFKRIQGKPAAELSAEEIDTIKNAAAPFYTALTLGQVHEMLDGEFVG